jgi:hypothetical protein
MDAYTLSHLSDGALLSDLAALVVTDRRTTARLLAHIAEVDARGLYLPAACSSMFAYCVRVLHLSEDAAFKRIRAARAARRFPQIFDAIADGRLHVTGVGLLAPHLTDENVDEVLAAAAHRTKMELDVLVARLAPRPDLPPAITPLVAPATSLPLPQLAPEPVAPTMEPPVTRMKPLAPERFALQVTISQATRDQLDRAQALLRHRNPSGDLAYVVELAAGALIAKLEREKLAATSRPRIAKPRPEDADPHYIPADVKRAVYERDAERCTFVSDTGERCSECNFLEIDHIGPVALRGQPTVDNLRLLCGPHNQYEADRKLGATFMRGKREKARKPQPSDLALALRGLGFTPAETCDAMTDTTPRTAPDFEARLRAALVGLTRARSSRCSDGPFDWNVHALGVRCVS